MRAIQRNVFPSVSELKLAHAVGDTAPYHVMMANRPALAEAEIAAGQLDSATAHVATLLRIPSALSEAAVLIDPLWAPIRANVLR